MNFMMLVAVGIGLHSQSVFVIDGFSSQAKCEAAIPIVRAELKKHEEIQTKQAHLFMREFHGLSLTCSRVDKTDPKVLEYR